MFVFEAVRTVRLRSEYRKFRNGCMAGLEMRRKKLASTTSLALPTLLA